MKKTETVVKGEPVSGRVIGNAAPPSHISNTPREHPEVQSSARDEHDDDEAFRSKRDNRQSVDWYAGLAADESHPAPAAESTDEDTAHLDASREEPELASAASTAEANGYEKIEVPETEGQDEDELAEFDLTRSTSWIERANAQARLTRRYPGPNTLPL